MVNMISELAWVLFYVSTFLSAAFKGCSFSASSPTFISSLFWCKPFSFVSWYLSFDLYLLRKIDELSKKNMFICWLCILLYRKITSVFCLLFNWVSCFFIVELDVSLYTLDINLLSRCVMCKYLPFSRLPFAMHRLISLM